MKIIKGKSISEGIAIGNIYIYKDSTGSVAKYQIEDVPGELERFLLGVKRAEEALKLLSRKALEQSGREGAGIFEAHQVMLQDECYLEEVKKVIKEQRVNAEYAVACTGQLLAKQFRELTDEYIKDRDADILDVTKRLLEALSGEAWEPVIPGREVILAAFDLSPSEAVRIGKSRLSAIITREGSVNSHVAVLSRTMGIPAIVQAEFTSDMDGLPAIVDGDSGSIYVEPDEETRKRFETKYRKEMEEKRHLFRLKGRDSITKDGRRLDITANIGNIGDCRQALLQDAAGVGLFRSEFLYLEKESYPSEEEQLAAYREVLGIMGDKPVTIRTLDIGGDKQADYFQIGREENPAMGYRGIRICLDRKEMFKTQLRALYRASVYGSLSVMYPMIISVWEVRAARELARQVQEGLLEEGIPFRSIRQGIMIETPAAALISDALAKEADFFSIGTNDLTQYTLAADRQNARLDSVYDPYHPAVLRMIRMTVENGHREHIRVGICGELAADTSLTEEFLDMGVDELSVSPGFVLKVKEKLRSI